MKDMDVNEHDRLSNIILIKGRAIFYCCSTFQSKLRGRRGRDRMVTGFTPSNSISAYHH